MFSDKRGAELVLYKLKKDSPDRLRLFACYLSGESLCISKKCVYCLLCYNINALCRLRLEAQCVCMVAACRTKIVVKTSVTTARVVAQAALHIVEVSVNLRVA